MMLSPQEYFEVFLNGKNADQIQTEIRRLKRKIRNLQRIISRPDYLPAICPSEDVQLICYREYLERAEKALAEVQVACLLLCAIL